MTTILFELGTEELPPKSLKTLRDALTDNVKAALESQNITYQAIKPFAAPRRLALQIVGISDKQPDRTEQKRGPAIKAAFDSDGNLTKAGLGFASGLGITKDDIITISTDKGDYIGYELTVQGKQGHVAYPHLAQNPIQRV